LANYNNTTILTKKCAKTFSRPTHQYIAPKTTQIVNQMAIVCDYSLMHLWQITIFCVFNNCWYNSI